MGRYIVVIGDLVRSKDLNDLERNTSQKILKKRLNKINEDAESILSPATITLGDEFQAVYTNLKKLLADCWEIMADLHPVGVRFSIGLGEIFTPINREQALGMDGPAFHAARDGIEDLKTSGRLFSLRIATKPEPEEAEVEIAKLANGTLQLMAGNMRTWRGKRYYILSKLIRELSVKQIAKDLDVSESAVYKNIKEGDLELIMQMRHHIGNTINRLMKNEYAAVIDYNEPFASIAAEIDVPGRGGTPESDY